MKKSICFLSLFMMLWQAGYSQLIQLQAINSTDPIIYDLNLIWTAPAGDSIVVFYSSDNGNSFLPVGKAITKPNGTGNFLLFTDQLTNSTQAKVKITDVHHPAESSVSQAFTLNHAIVTYNTPLASALYHTGQIVTLNISVQSYIPCSMVELYFSKDDGQTWQLVSGGSAADFTHFQWTVPAITSHHCRFGFWNGWNFQYIKSPRFTIVNPASPYGDDLVLTYPSGGEILNAGDPFTITWDTTALASRSIGIMVRESDPPYQTNCLIGMAGSRAGKAIIKVPYMVGNNFEVYVFSFNSGTPLMANSSNGSFQIRAPHLINQHFIDIHQPATNLVPAGSEVTISWDSYPGLGLVGVSRKYPNSPNNPVPVNLNNLTNTGQYTFTAPVQVGADIVIECIPYIQTASLISGNCSEKSTLTLRTTTATGNEPELQYSDVKLIPNPATESFRIESPANMTRISIRNLTGAEVYHSEPGANSSSTIDIRNLARGMYFVTVEEPSGISTLKLVKE